LNRGYIFEHAILEYYVSLFGESILGDDFTKIEFSKFCQMKDSLEIKHQKELIKILKNLNKIKFFEKIESFYQCARVISIFKIKQNRADQSLIDDISLQMKDNEGNVFTKGLSLKYNSDDLRRFEINPDNTDIDEGFLLNKLQELLLEKETIRKLTLDTKINRISDIKNNEVREYIFSNKLNQKMENFITDLIFEKLSNEHYKEFLLRNLLFDGYLSLDCDHLYFSKSGKFKLFNINHLSKIMIKEINYEKVARDKIRIHLTQEISFRLRVRLSPHSTKPTKIRPKTRYYRTRLCLLSD